MAFIVNAIPAVFLPDQGGSIDCRPVSLSLAKEMADVRTSAIGHADTAALISNQLGTIVEMNRISAPPPEVDREVYLLCAYKGPRLPEGVYRLPEGATLTFYALSVRSLKDRLCNCGSDFPAVGCPLGTEVCG